MCVIMTNYDNSVIVTTMVDAPYCTSLVLQWIVA